VSATNSIIAPSIENTLADVAVRSALCTDSYELPTNDLPDTTPAVTVDDVHSFVGIDRIERFLGRDETGDIELINLLYHERIVFDHSTNQYYLFDGNAFQPDSVHLMRRIIIKQLTDQYYQAKHHLTAQHKQFTQSGQGTQDELDRINRIESMCKNRIEKVYTVARQDKILKAFTSYVGITSNQWNADPWLLCVQNGVIDLHTGKHRPGRPSDRIRTVAPVEWTGINTPAPRWEQFLHEIFADHLYVAELVSFIHRLLGYSISGVTTEAIFPILYGEEGRNGKTIMLETIQSVLGPLSGAISPDVLLDSKAGSKGQATPHLCALQSKRPVWASETNEGRRLDSAQIKLATGGDTLTVRPLYGQQYSFTPTHTLFLLTNRLPHAPADDNALWDRIIVIPFNMRFVDNPNGPNERQRDPNLKQALEQELSGILAWLVRGCLAWQRDGLRVPSFLHAATNTYRRDEDDVQQFIDDVCYIGAADSISTKELYKAYQAWCEDQGTRPMSKQALGRRISKRFTARHGRIGTIYQGIRVRQSSEPVIDVMDISYSETLAKKDNPAVESCPISAVNLSQVTNDTSSLEQQKGIKAAVIDTAQQTPTHHTQDPLDGLDVGYLRQLHTLGDNEAIDRHCQIHRRDPQAVRAALELEVRSIP
jgi:putative DNA primase/helicase